MGNFPKRGNAVGLSGCWFCAANDRVGTVFCNKSVLEFEKVHASCIRGRFTYILKLLGLLGLSLVLPVPQFPDLKGISMPSRCNALGSTQRESAYVVRRSGLMALLFFLLVSHF